MNHLGAMIDQGTGRVRVAIAERRFDVAHGGAPSSRQGRAAIAVDETVQWVRHDLPAVRDGSGRATVKTASRRRAYARASPREPCVDRAVRHWQYCEILPPQGQAARGIQGRHLCEAAQLDPGHILERDAVGVDHGAQGIDGGMGPSADRKGLDVVPPIVPFEPQVVPYGTIGVGVDRYRRCDDRRKRQPGVAAPRAFQASEQW